MCEFAIFFVEEIFKPSSAVIHGGISCAISKVAYLKVKHYIHKTLYPFPFQQQDFLKDLSLHLLSDEHKNKAPLKARYKDEENHLGEQMSIITSGGLFLNRC